MSDPYRTSGWIGPGILVRVADPKVGAVIGRSDVRPGGWYVRWPNGLVTTEYEDTLVRADIPTGLITSTATTKEIK